MIDLDSKTFPVGKGKRCCALLNGSLVELVLQDQLGPDGAEGRVFKADASSGASYAVKIYPNEYLKRRADVLFAKLQYLMLVHESFSKSQEPVFAWPQATLHLGRRASDLTKEKFIGFVMPILPDLVDFYDLVKRSRRHGLPTLTQRIAVAYFLARGFKMLHAGASATTPAGSISMSFAVGDVNDSNIRVTDANIVSFFDCDSYIVRFGSEYFGQWTFTEAYSSPEFLAANDRSKYPRTAKDDEFGLAVLIFRLLNNWELPYRYDGGGAKAKRSLILDGRFPFADGSPDRVVPGTETTLTEYRSETHPHVKNLFERAFAKGKIRPTAAEWADGLATFLRSRPDMHSRPKPAPATISQSPNPRQAPPVVYPVGQQNIMPIQSPSKRGLVENLFLVVGLILLVIFVIAMRH